MNTRSQYQPHMIKAAHQVLLELASVWDDDLNKIVFVGGIACALLFAQDNDAHQGTIDIDVALDPAALMDYETDTLEEKLICANFQKDAPKAGEENRPIKNFRWFHHIQVDGVPVEVPVDLLTIEYDDSRRYKGAREVQGLHPSVLRGLDLAFLDPHTVPLSGFLSDNKTKHQTEIKVCSPACLLAMKGIAIADRLTGEDKDAYDIDYILRRYEGGVDAIARVLQNDAYHSNELVQEGLQGIAKAFRSLDAVGPSSIATNEKYSDPEERARVKQGAVQRVRRLLKSLNISVSDI